MSGGEEIPLLCRLQALIRYGKYLTVLRKQAKTQVLAKRTSPSRRRPRLKFFIPIFIVLSFLGHISLAQNEETILDARQLLDDVVLRLPREPLVISGELLVRKRKGIVVSELDFEMFINWGSVPASARYLLKNKKGELVEGLAMTRNGREKAEFKHIDETGKEKDEAPDLFGAIQESDVSWMDLSLSFLWWPGGTISGEEEIRGRNCHIVDLPSPAEYKSRGCSRVRLWVDEELRMLMKAESYGPNDDLKRKLWVKSFKKIEERWMIKDMEIQSYPDHHRTRLRVQEVTADTQT